MSATASGGDGVEEFIVMCTGQLEFGTLPGCDSAYCKYAFVHGDDWRVMDGLEDGITQITRKSTGADKRLVWNFPIEITYKSTNVYGWPQLCFSVFEVDALGRDIIRGYGMLHIPAFAGRYDREVRLFRPMSASLYQQFVSWITGVPAEFTDPRFVCRGEGREVTRVRSSGSLEIQLNVITKDMAAFGYSDQRFNGHASR